MLSNKGRGVLSLLLLIAGIIILARTLFSGSWMGFAGGIVLLVLSVYLLKR